MSEQFKIDLEKETIEVNGVQQGREELSAEITRLIAAGNFKIGALAGALEHLDQALAEAKSLSFKVSGELYAKLAELAKAAGLDPAVHARNLLAGLLGGSSASVSEAPNSEAASSSESSESSPESKSPALGSVQDLVDSVILTPKKRKADVVLGDEGQKGESAEETVLDLGVVARQK